MATSPTESDIVATVRATTLLVLYRIEMLVGTLSNQAALEIT